MVWNNLSFMDNTTTFSGVATGVNVMAGGWLFGGLMLLIFVVSLMVFYGRVGVTSILIGNGFILSLLAVLFINMGALPIWVLGMTVSVLIIGLVGLFMGE